VIVKQRLASDSLASSCLNIVYTNKELATV
jgi:hypothetical protein